MNAALNGQTEVTKLLLEHNADVQYKTTYGKYTNIYTIIKLFNLCILTPLYIYIGFTSLMYAAQKGYLEIIKLLLEHNADVEAKTNSGYYL